MNLQVIETQLKDQKFKLETNIAEQLTKDNGSCKFPSICLLDNTDATSSAIS